MKTRRLFLKQILRAIGLLALAPRVISAEVKEWIPIGDIEEFPLGVPKVVSEDGVIVVRTKSDIRAMSLYCTHRGCPLGVAKDNKLECNCHGAKFDLQGKVLKGPAKKPLPKIPVKVENGEILIFNVQRPTPK